jgi:hypothetical protein
MQLAWVCLSLPHLDDNTVCRVHARLPAAAAAVIATVLLLRDVAPEGLGRMHGGSHAVGGYPTYLSLLIR